MGGSGSRRSAARSRFALLLVAGALVAGMFPPAVAGAAPSPSTPPGDPVTLESGGAANPYVVERAPAEIGVPTTGRGDPAAPASDPSIRRRPAFPPAAPPSAKTPVRDRWTEGSRTYANPDGSFTLQASSGRLNFQDPAGTWQELDLDLVREAAGPYGLRVKASDRLVRFAAADTSQALASITSTRGSVSVRTLDFTGTPVQAPGAEAPGEAPAPTPSATGAPLTAPEASASPAAQPPLDSASSAPAASGAAPEQTAAPAASPEPSPVGAEGTGTTGAASGGSDRPHPRGASLRFTDSPDQGEVYVRPSDTGFEFGAVLDRPDQARQYAFALDPGGLTASLAADGRTVLLTTGTDPAALADPAGVISAPVLMDADEVPAPPEAVTVELIQALDPGHGRASERALQERRANETVLVYTIDAAWLTADGRAFPVTLDPDACLSEGASGCAINGTGTNLDHFVMSGLPTQYPVGWTILRVGDDARTTDGDEYGNMRALVYFEDVTLPDGAMVYDTNLQLHISSTAGGPAGQTISVYRVKKGWGQGSTWNDWSSGAGYDTAPSASTTVPSSGNMNFDVDGIVHSWYTRRGQDWKGDIGFAVRMNYEGSDAGEVGFDRYNDTTASYRPELVIHYEIPKVAIDFDPALGANYAPSTMVADQATVLPIRITNNTSGFDFDTTNWRVGYRWFDAKGNLVGTAASQALTQCVGPTAGCASPSATIALAVTPPATVGQYTLRLDLVRNGSIDTYASDWATPSKFYSRNKKALSADNTRWTGSSVVERDEFGIAVVAGGGDTGTVKSVGTGDGGALGVDLWSRNLSYTGAGGVGFADLIPLQVDYGYDSKHTAVDCAGILDACGWWTSYDERFIEGSGVTYAYVDSTGNRHLADTDANQQVVSGAPVLLQRPRMTLYDDQVPSATTNVSLVSGAAETPAFTPFSHDWAVRAKATTFPSSTDLGYSRDVILNTYRNVRFAIRTSGATTAAIGFQVKNVTTNASAKWFVYTIGSSTWSAGDDSLWLGTGVTVGSGGWSYVARNLYQDVRDADLGGTFDEYRLDNVRIYYKAGLSGTQYTYLDALRLEPAESAIVEDNDPAFTSGDSLATLVTDDKAAGSASLKVSQATIGSSPNCITSNSCWSTSAGGLWSYAFAHWQWKKVGGTTAAMVFHFKNERSGATGDLTYYAGPSAPAGAVNPIQVSDVAPENWTKVTVNLLEDARQVLNFFNDGPKTTSPGAPPTQGPTPDNVRLTGYRISAVDGNFVLIDDFDYGSLPEVGSDQLDHPASSTDSTFTYDFTATYRDGSIHYFNTRGLLTRIANRDGDHVDLDWTIPDPTVYGPAGFRLDAIRAATDGTTDGSWTYDRELRFTYTGAPGTADRTVKAAEWFGTAATGRTMVFTMSAANDVVSLKPARAPGDTCPPSGASGCVLLSYDATHGLTMVADPRWDQEASGGNDYRFEVSWSGGAPAAIIDRSQETDTPILKVLTYDAAGSELPAAARAAWQDAAALRSNTGLYEDLTSDGRQLLTYIPTGCAGTCSASSLPDASGLAARKATESQFDGLARESTSIQYRCPGVAVSGCSGTAQKIVSRQGTKAGAKVNNYNDPLTAGQTGWTQSPDQHVASLRDSNGLDPDLYRTFYAYDDNGQQVEATRMAFSARPDYPAAIKSTTQSASRLIGYWRFAESSGTTAADAAPTPHHGTYTGGVALARTGALVGSTNTAAGLDGSNDYVLIPSAFGTVTGTFSVEAWVKPDSATTTMAFIGSRKSTTASTDYSFDAKLRYDSTTRMRHIRVDVGNGTAWLATLDFPFDYQANRWYHVAALIDDPADTVTVAVNGAIIGTKAFTTAGTPLLADTTRLLKIGNNGRDATTPEWFDGDIDEVAVWSQVLTRVQVEAHYLAGRSGARQTIQTLYDNAWRPLQVDDQMLASSGFESLLADWDFGQGSGGTVYTATGLADPKVRQPADASLPPSWASFATGTGGNVQQDVQLTPGQTVRFQVWETRLSSATALARINLYYWRKSDGSWQALVNKAYASATWTGHAWDVTLPFDTDGRVRVALWVASATAGDSIYFDDAAVFTTFGRTTYTTTGFTGLPRDRITLAPTQDGPVAEYRERSAYAAEAAHPAVFPTTTTANHVDGAFDPLLPDEDVATTSTFDAWGHALAVTDADGVARTTTYRTSPEANGYATDIVSAADGLDQATTYTHDLVGNRLTETTPAPLGRTTTTTYDLRNHAVSVQAPAPVSTVTRHVYDAYGFVTASIENWVDGTPSGPAGLDDLTTSYTYDEYGFRTLETGNTGVTGPDSTRTQRKHDLLGNTTETAVFASYDGTTFASPRTTTERFEVVAGVTRPTASASRGPGSFSATAANAPGSPLCPDGSGDRCNSLMTLDQEGRTVALTDAYGKVTRTYLDLAGRTAISIANYADGSFDPASPDTDIVTLTVNDLFGRAAATIDTLGRRTATTFDRLGRVTRVRTYDSTGAAVSDTRTVYTAAGRADRVSMPGKAVNGSTDQPDSAFTWTKSVYDRAGKVVQTLAHYDITGAAGLAVASFERTLDDETIDRDGIAQRWSASADTFISGGASLVRDGSAVRTGLYGMRITLGTGANSGAQWYLDGTFKGGRTYRARVWVQPNGQTVSARLGTLASSSSIVSASGTAWQPIDLTWAPATDQAGVRLAIYRSSAGTATSVYADNVVVWDSAAADTSIPTETAYDAEGHIIASVVAPGTVGTAEQPMVTATAYDALGRMTSVTVNAIAGAGTSASDVNLTTLTSFDALGRADTSTDPTGTVIRAVYDRLGRQTSTIENDVAAPDTGQYAADDVTSTFAYNAAGELVGNCPAAQVWATGCVPGDSAEVQAWRYAYDDAGRLAIQTPPVNTAAQALATTRWEYDAGGRLAKSCDALPAATSCADTTAGAVIRTVVPTYDAVGRAIQTDVYSGAGVTLGLRNETTYFGDGKPKQIRYSEGSTPTLKDTLDLAYDALGRETKVSRGTTVITERDYYEDGTLKWRRDGDAPNGANPAIGQTDFTYDWAKRLQSVNLPDSYSTAEPTFGWRLDGLIGSRTWGAGASATFAYDTAKRPTSFTKGSLSFTQAYDRDNNVVSEGRSGLGVTGDAGENTQTFTYDALNRVTGSAGLATGARSYTYDRDGNRRTKTEGGDTFTYTVDRTDQLVSVIKTGGTTQWFSYDARGNLTGDAQTAAAVTNYTYDLANKLTGIDAAGTANDASFTFDALGRFATRVLGGGASTDTYSYAGTDEIVIRIASSTAGTTDSITSAAGDRLAAKAGSTLNWFLPDLHGSVAASLSADEATVTNAIRYDAWGQAAATGSAGGTRVAERAWKYQGRLDVAPEGLATPLYDMSARFYAPGAGTFTQADTVMGTAADPLSMNRYLYAQANPATLTDPSGHIAFLALLVPVAIGFFAGAGIDAGVQQVTTGTVDWGAAAFSGAVGAATGGVGGVATAVARPVITAGVRAVAGTAARPVVTRVATAVTGAGVQAVTDQVIQTAALPPDQRDTGWQSGAVSATTELGTEAAFETGKRLPGWAGRTARLLDGVFGGGGGKGGPKPAVATSKYANNEDLIQSVADRADARFAGSGPAVGSQKHAYADRLLDRYQKIFGSRGLLTEKSWELHQGVPRRVPYGTKGSTRVDVLDTATRRAYDYKFGGARMSSSQRKKIVTTTPATRVFTVRPTSAARRPGIREVF